MSSNTVNEAVDFLVGDIIVDTKYSYGGHAMLVAGINPLQNRVSVSHAAFTFPNMWKWEKYASFENRDPKQGTAKYILRWIGPEIAIHHTTGEYQRIRTKLVEVVLKLHHLVKQHKDLDYSRVKGACMFYKNQCFTSNQKISHKSLEEIQATESFVCSSYTTFVWKYVLEQFEIPEELRNTVPADAHTLDDIGLRINPYECLPRDLLQLAEMFPDYWVKIPYYTRKIEMVEMKELTNKRIPVATASAASSSSSNFISNLSMIPYSFGGKRKATRRRRHKKRRTARK